MGGGFWRRVKSSTECLIEIDYGKVFVAKGITESDAGIEETSLCVEHVYIVETSATVLHMGKLHVFCGGIAKLRLQ